VLETRATTEIATLRDLTAQQEVVLLDYTTNGDVTDLRTPLSHAALVANHVRDEWPES